MIAHQAEEAQNTPSHRLILDYLRVSGVSEDIVSIDEEIEAEERFEEILRTIPKYGKIIFLFSRLHTFQFFSNIEISQTAIKKYQLTLRSAAD